MRYDLISRYECQRGRAVHISEVKPDLNSMLHFFDIHHNFATRVSVYFINHHQQMRAVILFPLHQTGSFTLEALEVFHHGQWSPKRGDSEIYGKALADHHIVVLLGNYISSIEIGAHKQLEIRFRQVVFALVRRLKEELQPYRPLDFEISRDYLSILPKFEYNGEILAGRIETNFYFPHTAIDESFVEEIVYSQVLNIKKRLEQHNPNLRHENDKVYVTTVPILNPVCDEEYEQKTLEVSILSIGQCPKCNGSVNSSSNFIKINLLKLNQHQDDLLIIVVGDTFLCEVCRSPVKKDHVLVSNLQRNEVIAERLVKELDLLGDMSNQDKINQTLTQAVDHHRYFQEHEEAFWSAFAFVAMSKWDRYIRELTRKELYDAFGKYLPQISFKDTKEELVKSVLELDFTRKEKGRLWRKANERVVHHFLFITVFGWDMRREVRIIGQNRSEFIFKYLPVPVELRLFQQRHEAYFSNNGDKERLHLHRTIERQQHQIKLLQQENGRLTQKLGNAYSRISELEQASISVRHETRNKRDILKIQQLKGLIEELKSELSLSMKPLDAAERIEEGFVLTEEQIEQETDSVESILRGKHILILGGYRAKQYHEENDFIIHTHDARNLGPVFYESLKKADIIVVLTRFISHRAMWEAKEYAILEEKSIYYTSFINIPTILAEVAMGENK